MSENSVLSGTVSYAAIFKLADFLVKFFGGFLSEFPMSRSRQSVASRD